MSAAAAAPNPSHQWKYAKKAKEFRQSHEPHARYIMVFRTQAVNVVEDPTWPARARVMEAIRLFAWGHLSDFAVDRMPKVDPDDEEPRKIDQADLATKLALPKSTVSEACTYLRRQGYLRSDVSELIPEMMETPTLFAGGGVSSDIPNSKNDNHLNYQQYSPFLRHKKVYLEKHPELAEKRARITAEINQLDDAYREARRVKVALLDPIEKEILTSYRNHQRKEKKAAAAGSNAPNKEFGLPEQKVRTPRTELRDVRTDSISNHNGISDDSSAPLKVLRFKEENQSSVGRSCSGIGMPPAADRPTELNGDSEDQTLKTRVRNWMILNLHPRSRFPLGDDVLDRVMATIHNDEEFMVFQEAALNQKNPDGWKVYATIAERCQEIRTIIEKTADRQREQARVTTDTMLEPANVAANLERSAAQLARAGGQYAGLAGRLRTIAADPDLHLSDELESSLFELDAQMISLAKESLGGEDLLKISRKVSKDVLQYSRRGLMTADQIKAIEQQLFTKELVDQLDLPRLSIYFMQ